MQVPTRQVATVDALGRSLAPSIHGVKEYFPVTHQDERGTLCEIYSTAWAFDDVPLVHPYLVTIRPAQIKGWAAHEIQTDRYFFAHGSTQLVLFDDRPESPTYRMVTSKVYSELNRALVSVPPGIWHAVRAVGLQDSLLFNLPSRAYDHACPDKLVLPLETDRIPYSFMTNGRKVSGG